MSLQISFYSFHLVLLFFSFLCLKMKSWLGTSITQLWNRFPRPFFQCLEEFTSQILRVTWRVISRDTKGSNKRAQTTNVHVEGKRVAGKAGRRLAQPPIRSHSGSVLPNLQETVTGRTGQQGEKWPKGTKALAPSDIGSLSAMNVYFFFIRRQER